MTRAHWYMLGMLLLACTRVHAVDQYECYNGISEQGGHRLTVNGIQSAQYAQQSYPATTVTVYAHGTTTLSTIFSDAAGAVPLSNPFTSTSNAAVFFCAADARYDVKYSGTTITTAFTISDIHLCFACTGSGGGGGTVGPGTINQVAKFTPSTTTIGDSTGFDDGTHPVQWPNGITVRANAIYKTLTNASAGTTTNTLAQKDSSGNAITATTSSTKVIGIVDVGGTTGTVDIAFGGFHTCIADGAVAVNDYIVPSGTTGGQCSSAGATKPSNAQIIGTAVNTASVVGDSFIVDLFTGDTLSPGSSGGSGTVSNCGSSASNAYYSIAGTVVACDQFFTDDGAGNGTAKSLGLTDATKAGFAYFVQGTAPGIGPATSVTMAAPASVTAYEMLLPGTAATGCLQGTNVAGVVTMSFGSCATGTLTDTHIFVGNGSNVATDVALSGDATIANTGVLTLAAQYKKAPCQTGLGDGLNAMPAGTYLQSFCYNDSGVTQTLTGIKCLTDNNGTSTMNVTNGAGTALLTGAITCTNAFAAGTQSGTVTIASGDYLKFTFVADGTSKQTTWVITKTQ